MVRKIDRHDRYRRIRLLGEGGAGKVWLVEDTRRPGRQLALKELAEPSVGREETLRSEFATLAALRHPNLVEVHDFDISPSTGLAEFSLEYIDGPDIVQAIQEEGPGVLLDLAAEALRALSFLHDFGLIHRDLKPGNLLVRHLPKQDCRLVVLDFGMAFQGSSEGGQAAPSGTLPYMAPELFAGEQADRRSDLYALGALLHEAIHGIPPFDPDPGDLAAFVARVSEGARARPSLPEGFPAGLRDWLEELLTPDPASRPAGASEALARLNAACGTSYEIETGATRAARLASGPPPGREKELERLWDLLSPASASRFVLLTGGAGSGKTRILRWLVSEAVRNGWNIAAAAGLSDGAALELGRGSLSESLSELRQVAADNHTLVLLDEVETAGSEIVELLDRIAREGKSSPFRVVAAFRPTEVGKPTLRQLMDDSDILPAVDRVDLAPLDSEAIAKLAERVLGTGSVSPQRASWLHDASEGNPLLAESLLVDQAWERGGKHGSHPTLKESIAGRVESLSSDARNWLKALVVLETASTEDLVSRLSDLDGEKAEQATKDLRDAGLTVPSSAGWSPSSRLIGEYVLESLDPSSSRQLHENAARLLTGTEEATPEVLALLWSGAGVQDLARVNALQAADLAEQAKRPAEAADWLRFALLRLERHDPERLSLRLRHADLLMVSAQYRLAFSALATCLRLSKSQSERASLLHKQTRTLVALGHYKRALAAAQESQVLADVVGLPTVAANAKWVTGMALIRMTHYEKALPILQQAAIDFEQLKEPSRQAECCYLAAVCNSNLRNFDAARQSFKEALKLAKETRESRIEANILTSMGNLESRAWRLQEALSCFEQARGVATSRNLKRQQSAILANIATVHLEIGSCDKALQVSREAETIALNLGSRYWLHFAKLMQANSMVQAGRHMEAAGIVTVLLEDGRFSETGNRNYAKITLVEALLQDSDPDGERISILNSEILKDPSATPKQTIAALMLEMERRCRPACTDPFGPMRTRYEEETTKHPESLEPPLAVRAELAKTRHLIEAANLDAAMETARNAARFADDKDLPALAARAQALLAEAQTKAGDSQQAKRSLRRGRQFLEDAAERIEDAQIRSDFLDHPAYAALRTKGGKVEGEEDRLLAIYDMIRTLNSETDPDALLESMLDMALRVVKAERGMILLGDAEHDYQVRLARNLEKETISDAAEFSKNVVLQAGAGKAVLAMDTGQDERLRDLKSVSMYGIRSVICVPLRSRAKIIGAVYLDNRTGGALFSPDDLRFLEAFADHAALSLENAQIRKELENENLRLQQAAEERVQFDNIIGRCPAMQQVYDLIAKVAASHLPVLIQGESGTGKELVAKAVHYNGPRKRKPFLTENCAAIPETLLESELFGHVRGAFTGAERDRQGLFEQADTGTLFLDEVGDMSPSMQARLLRVIQEGEVRRVGGEQRTTVDVRLLTATHRTLQEEAAEGRFREDLLYRLQVLVIQLPPLRERPGDIPLLVNHFLQRIGKERGQPVTDLRSAVMELLARNSWPGNIRQLENTLQRLTLLAGDGPITTAVVESDQGLRRLLFGEPEATAAIYSLERNEEERIREALKATSGNRTRAAKLLGISRATIFRKIKHYEL